MKRPVENTNAFWVHWDGVVWVPMKHTGSRKPRSTEPSVNANPSDLQQKQKREPEQDVCVRVCVCVSECVCLCVCICVGPGTCFWQACICICVFVCMCMSVCVGVTNSAYRTAVFTNLSSMIHLHFKPQLVFKTEAKQAEG